MEGSTSSEKFEQVLVDREGEVATVTINRPRVLNALAVRTKQELGDAFRALAMDPGLRVIVLRGAGERAFCVGTDVREMRGFSVLDAQAMLQTEHALYDAIRRTPQPVIAMINGYALGGGCVLAMACDYAIAASNVRIGLPEIQVGVPAPIEVALLPWLVGLARTRELVLLGEPMTAEEALRIGLINQVVPLAQLPGAVRDVAVRFVQRPRSALRVQKELINRWIETDLQTAIATSIPSTALCFATAEPHEAIDAFLQRKASRNGARYPKGDRST